MHYCTSRRFTRAQKIRECLYGIIFNGYFYKLLRTNLTARHFELQFFHARKHNSKYQCNITQTIAVSYNRHNSSLTLARIRQVHYVTLKVIHHE